MKFTVVMLTNMQHHIQEVAAENLIVITWRKTRGGRAWRKSRRASLYPIKTDVDYAVALHEFGHILGPNPIRRLDQEWAAWKWAQDNALLWTRAMTEHKLHALSTYVAWALRREQRDGRKRTFLPAGFVTKMIADAHAWSIQHGYEEPWISLEQLRPGRRVK